MCLQCKFDSEEIYLRVKLVPHCYHGGISIISEVSDGVDGTRRHLEYVFNRFMGETAFRIFLYIFIFKGQLLKYKNIFYEWQFIWKVYSPPHSNLILTQAFKVK